MPHILPGRFACIAPALLVLLSACNQSAPPETAAQAVASPMDAAQAAVALAPIAETCASNAQVAVDFLNLYIRHLNDQAMAANPPDTYEWLKSSSLVDPSVASAYAASDSIDADPILDAQDYPNTFESAGCPGAADIVHVRGIGMNLNVRVKVASVAGAKKVVGVGRINMPRNEVQPDAALAASVNDRGSDAECVAGTDGAPAMGAPYNEGVYLCREPVEIYWNDWYAVSMGGSPATLQVKAEGKTSGFEGTLEIDCTSGEVVWSNAIDFDMPVDVNQEVPDGVVTNARSIACRS